MEKKSFLREWGPTFAWMAFILAAMWLFLNFVFGIVTINGTSMEPNLLDKQMVGVNHLAKIQRGDVVVFDARGEDPRIKPGNKDYVKRVIGVPGDTVSYSDGNIYVNGKKINQDFISSDEQNAGTEMTFGSTWSLKTLSASTGGWKTQDQNTSKVPAGEYFVMGDHRSVSNDGRYFGYVSRSHITGKVVVPFWYSNTIKQYVDHQNKDFFA
ncbi:signal peptidase I [Leuconostocaceae bacterium ESL0723]|nr:signal peptidase I [Lactobacillaceae bacterium L1_55_11]WEV54714.1 signal peptidase I [Leuconostocaceae bacterium ESL0723]